MRTVNSLLAALAISVSIGISSVFAQVVRIMPLGDSITQGVGSTDSAGYRDDLAAMLDAAGVTYDFVGQLSNGTGFDADHEGHPGYTAAQVDTFVDQWLQASSPDLVILQIGTNDLNQGATPDELLTRITSIVDKILAYNPQTKILLASLLPRTDALDSYSEETSRMIQNLASSKRESGYAVYFVGLYYIFKAQPNWNTDLMYDAFHPNDQGYALVAEVVFHVMRRALGLREDVADDFSRDALGHIWVHGGGYTIQNGAIANETPGQNWDLAMYLGHANPKVVEIVWDSTVTSAGVKEGGVALMLNSEDPAQADGYLVWHNGTNISLWTIVDGVPDQPIMDAVAQLPMPGPGDTFRVVVTTDANQHRFDCYVNGELDGVVFDANKLYGNTPYWFAGVDLRGGLANNVATFDVVTEADLIAPAPITDLTVESVSSSSVLLTWTAPGDDGQNGQAASYDVRYSTQPIDYFNFESSPKVSNPPLPSAPGTKESLWVLGLQPNTNYYFAIRTADDVGNLSAISNVANAITSGGTILTDTFDRTDLGPDWVAGPEWQIVNGALHNGGTDNGWDHIAIYKAKKNPAEISLTWAPTADAAGINEGGLGVLDDTTLTANGYLVWITTQYPHQNQIHLWSIVNGQVSAGTEIDAVNSQAPVPQASSVFKVVPRIQNGNKLYFDVFVDGNFAGTVADISGSPVIGSGPYYGAVVSRAGLANDVDAFSIMSEVGQPSVLTLVQGDGQVDTVGRWLPDSVLVRVTDENDNPISGVPVQFQVLQGGGEVAPAVNIGPHLRVDIGGPGFDEVGGIHWEADQPYPQGTWELGNWGYEGGNTYATTDPIGGTNKDALYQTERWDIRAFHVDVPPGEYTVRLHFAELFYQSSGMRVFHVNIEGVRVLTNFDIFAEAGNKVALVKEFVVQVNDGTLDVTFDGVVESPEITGIEVFQGDEGLYTDSRGIVGVRWKLGPTAGQQTLRVLSPGLQNSPLDVTATALPDVAQELVYVAGGSQSGAAGTVLPEPLTVKVIDQYGNGIPDQAVHFRAIQGGGRFQDSGISETTILTDTAGLARANFILGSLADTNVVYAEVQGLQGSPVVFKEVATSGVAKTLEYVAGSGQTGTVGTRLPDSLQVRVLDQIGQAVPGIAVRFRILQGNGTLSDTLVQTDSRGIASVSWQLGTVAGLQKVEASVSGLQGSPVQFSALANPDSPYGVTKVTADSLHGAAGKVLQDTIRVKVVDQYGNPIQGHEVTFYIVSGGGDIGGATDTTVTTGGGGVAAVLWRLGPTPGATNQLGFRALNTAGAHLAGSPGQFTAFAGDVDRLEYMRGDDQIVSVRRKAPVPLEVQVIDEFGYVVANYPVTFRVKSGSATFGGGAGDTVKVVETNSQGVASVDAVMGSVYGDSILITAEAKNSHGQQVQNSPYRFNLRTAAIRSVEYVSGNGQTGRAGELLPNPFVVLVRDSLNNPAPDYEVSYHVVEGGGNFDGDTVKVVRTDDSGKARATLRVGTNVGQQNVVLARVFWKGQEVLNSPVQFTASTTAGLPDSLIYVDGDRQEGLIGTALPKPLKVKVKDRYGNGVPGHTVTFTVTAGGGSLDQAGQTSVTKTTNSQGICEVRWILGNQAGLLNNVVEARSSYDQVELNGSPVIFRATAYSTNADSMAYVSGNNATGIVGEILPSPLRVRVFDEHGNPVVNHPVTFEVIQGGGVLMTPSDTSTTVVAVTDRDGYAQSWLRLGTKAGVRNNVVRASATDGVNPLRGSPVMFYATAIAATPLADSCLVTAHPGTLKADGVTKATLTAVLKDRYGNPVPGKAVIFDVVGEDARVEQPTALTDESGMATGRLSSTKSGWKIATARDITDQISIDRGARILFLPLEASKIVYYSGNSQTGNVGTVLAESLAVQVLDRYDNPIVGYPVEFVVTEHGGGILEPQPVLTDSDGIAAVHMQLGIEPGDNLVEARAEGLQGSPVLFREIGVVGKPARIDVVSGDGQKGTAGEFLKDSLVVQVLDEDGDPVWGVPVQFQAPSGGLTWPEVDTTDAYGKAFTFFRLGESVGNYQVVAVVSSVNDHAVFTATAVAGDAARVRIVSGQGQSGVVGAKLRDPLVVQVVDKNGNGVQGVTLEFQVITGAGSLSPSGQVVSDEQGLCMVQWTLGTRSGKQTVRVSAEDLEGVPLYFWAKALPAAPDSMMAYSGNNQRGQVGQTLPLPVAVKVIDVYGNPVPNVNLTFTPVDGMSSVEQTNVLTDSLGIAQTHWTLGNQPGQNVLWVIKLGVKGSPVVFTAVGEANDYPVITCPSDTSILENQKLEFTVSAVDPDGGAVHLGARNLPPGASFDSTATGRFTWTPNYKQAGVYTVIFYARDDEGGVQNKPVRITVLNNNRPPEIVTYAPAETLLTATYGDSIVFNIAATDPDEDSLLYSWVTIGSEGQRLVSTIQQYKFLPSRYDPGDLQVIAYVSDGTDTVRVAWHVTVLTAVELESFMVEMAPFRGVVIRWKTTREIGTVGFNVYRSAREDGEYVKINSHLIPTREDHSYAFVDRRAEAGKTYYYRLEDVSASGHTAFHDPVSITVGVPKTFTVYQNFPNPFNPVTTIRFELPKTQHVRIEIFNVLGQKVRVLLDEQVEAGYHELRWDGRDDWGNEAVSGVYYLRVSTAKDVRVKKMLLLR